MRHLQKNGPAGKKGLPQETRLGYPSVRLNLKGQDQQRKKNCSSAGNRVFKQEEEEKRCSQGENTRAAGVVGARKVWSIGNLRQQNGDCLKRKEK